MPSRCGQASRYGQSMSADASLLLAMLPSLRLQSQDLPVQVRELVDQALELLVAGGHQADLLQVADADVAGAGDAVELEGEVVSRSFGPLGGNRAEQKKENFGGLSGQRVSLLLWVL